MYLLYCAHAMASISSLQSGESGHCLEPGTGIGGSGGLEPPPGERRAESSAPSVSTLLIEAAALRLVS